MRLGLAGQFIDGIKKKNEPNAQAPAAAAAPDARQAALAHMRGAKPQRGASLLSGGAAPTQRLLS